MNNPSLPPGSMPIWTPEDARQTAIDVNDMTARIQGDPRARRSDDDVEFDSDMAYLRGLADAIDDELYEKGGTVAPPPETPAFDEGVGVEMQRKRSWFERLTPWWVLAALPGLIIGAALYFSAPGHADPDADQKAGIAYGQAHSREICAAISKKPSVEGVTQAVLDAMGAGLSPAASGAAVAYAVMTTCDQFEPQLDGFVTKYAKPQAQSGRIA